MNQRDPVHSLRALFMFMARTRGVVYRAPDAVSTRIPDCACSCPVCTMELTAEAELSREIPITIHRPSMCCHCRDFTCGTGKWPPASTPRPVPRIRRILALLTYLTLSRQRWTQKKKRSAVLFYYLKKKKEIMLHISCRPNQSVVCSARAMQQD